MHRKTGRDELPESAVSSFHSLRSRCVRLAVGGWLLLVCLVGCPNRSTTKSSVEDSATADRDRHMDSAEGATRDAAEPFAVWVVDDPGSAANLEREWNADSALPVVVTALTAQQLGDGLRTEGPLFVTADVILFPAMCLGELAERNVIEPMPDSVASNAELSEAILPPDTFSMLRARATRWGNRAHAATFGGAPWMVLYRKDLLDKLALAPPQTWNEVQQVLDRVSAELSMWRETGVVGPSFQPWLAPTANGLAAQTLLCRAVAYARHPSHYSTLFDYRTFAPLIDRPPFVRALEESQAAWSSGGGTYEKLDERKVEQRFLAGLVAMALWRPVRFAASVPAETGVPGHGAEITSQQIGVMPLPGSRECFSFGENKWESHPDGVVRRAAFLGPEDRLGGVVARSRRRRVGWVFLGRLATGERAVPLTTLSAHSSPFRQSHLQQPGPWLQAPGAHGWREALAEPLCAAIAATYGAEEVLVGPRVPGALEYLQTLDAAVLAALGEEADAAHVLARVSAQWAVTTDKLGAESQRAAYLRSLGLQP